MDEVDQTTVSAGQLRWRCRRGTKELDRFFTDFLDGAYDQSPPHIQNGFVLLLEQQDPDIYDWLMGASTPLDNSLEEVVSIMRSRMGLH